VTGIVCTISEKTVMHLNEMKKLGMSMIRVNGSFDIPDIGELKKVGVPILIDLPGKREKNRPSRLTDRQLLKLAIDNDVNYVGLSYVKSSKEVRNLKNKLKQHGADTGVVAKIETKSAVRNMKSIIKAADMVLIDRGDLGTDIGFEKVPYYQFKTVGVCKRLGKKVIIATEMLMSLINAMKPNCADVTDIFNAVVQGADYVMLSEETAVFDNPINPVKNMRKVIDYAEKSRFHIRGI